MSSKWYRDPSSAGFRERKPALPQDDIQWGETVCNDMHKSTDIPRLRSGYVRQAQHFGVRLRRPYKCLNFGGGSMLYLARAGEGSESCRMGQAEFFGRLSQAKACTVL